MDRGVVRYLMDQVDEAIADYNESLRLRPQDPRTYYNRASAYRKKGQIDQAIADYRSALDLDPTLVQAEAKLKEIGVDVPHR